MVLGYSHAGIRPEQTIIKQDLNGQMSIMSINIYSSMASKPIIIRWIRTSSQHTEKLRITEKLRTEGTQSMANKTGSL